MCLFPIPNSLITGVAYKKGLEKFNCGYCPECLKQRANVWALRSVYQSKESVQNMMITLTYDTYKRDDRGRIIGENVPDPDIILSKRHVQLFIKRLRKYIGDVKIKYIICGEHGSRTHRAHYHALIFGYCFPDLIPYKKSKRGNQIYKSPKLTELWGHGICTVDSKSVNGSISRYCTKYIAKNTRTDDCFMLFSRGIGEKGLLKDFNGKFYTVEGRRYPIPKQIWNKVIFARYRSVALNNNFDYRYVCRDNPLYKVRMRSLKFFRELRDSDPQYKRYLEYWSWIGDIVERTRPKCLDRIRLLDDSKFHFYKASALSSYNRKKNTYIYTSPRKPLGSTFERTYEERFHLPAPSRLVRANDTKNYDFIVCKVDNDVDLVLNPFDNSFLQKKLIQDIEKVLT